MFSLFECKDAEPLAVSKADVRSMVEAHPRATARVVFGQ